MQITSVERLQRFMKRESKLSPQETARQIDYAIRDNLVNIIKRVGHKGSKTGVEQESHRIPYESPMRDGHDWYCFVCHQPGEVNLCRNCWRVVHPNCLEPHQVGISPPFHCYVCEAAKSLTI